MLSQSFNFDVDVNQNKAELTFSRIRTGKSDGKHPTSWFGISTVERG